MSETKVALAEAIENLRQELKVAEEAGRDEDLRLIVDGIEIELDVEITREAGPKGKVSFNVFGSGAELSGGAQFGKSRAHRIKLCLRPKPAEGEEAYETGDRAKARRQ